MGLQKIEIDVSIVLKKLSPNNNTTCYAFNKVMSKLGFVLGFRVKLLLKICIAMQAF